MSTKIPIGSEMKNFDISTYNVALPLMVPNQGRYGVDCPHCGSFVHVKPKTNVFNKGFRPYETEQNCDGPGCDRKFYVLVSNNDGKFNISVSTTRFKIGPFRLGRKLVGAPDITFENNGK